MKKLESIAIIEQKILVPMRDGVGLAADIYRPADATDALPTVFVRTPYNFNTYRDGEPRTRGLKAVLKAVERGYAYIVQNERGRYFSEGEWDILGPPTTDGYDTLTWIAEQPWSNGKVGTIGCSSSAEWQMGLAALDHPAHAAMIPQGFGAGIGRVGRFYEQGNWYRGGAEQMVFFSWLYGVQNTQRPTFSKDISHEDIVRLSRYFDLAPEMPEVDWEEAFWHLPVEDLMRSVDGPEGIFADPAPVATGGRMIQRTPNDPAWYKGGLYHDDEPFGVPSLWWMSWYDVSISPNLALFNHVRENAADPEIADSQYALIAPVGHCGYRRSKEEMIVGERNMGDVRFEYDQLTYDWFDYWLKGEDNGVLEKTPKVQYYLMGKNEWKSSSTWPPEGAEMVTYFLDSGGKANSLFGDGRLTTDAAGIEEPTDTFTYDPFNSLQPGSFLRWKRLLHRQRHHAGFIRSTTDGSAQRHPRLHQRSVAGRRRGQRLGRGHPVRLVGCRRHGFHRQADRRLPRRPGLQSGRDHSSRPLSRRLRTAGLYGGGRGLRADDEPDVDQQLLRRGAPHSDRGLEQQLPSLHPQPQHRRKKPRRDGGHCRSQHGAPLSEVPLPDQSTDCEALARLRQLEIERRRVEPERWRRL
jgi:putative CocE/NonD family hydrolase